MLMRKNFFSTLLILIRFTAQVSILIVDDDPVNMTILDDLLKSAGYDTLLAGGLPS